MTADGTILFGITATPAGVVSPDGRFALLLGRSAGRAPDISFLVRSR